jgi:septal ring factor EnvC (AmiA/AmiB activator)
MNKAYLFIAFMAFMNISLAQKENINVESSVQDLKTEISRINNQLGDLSKDLVSIGSTSKQNEKNISQIHKSIKILSNNVNAINRSLDIKITQTGKRNEDQIDELGGDLERSRLYWIIASLSILVLGFVMYIFISKRIKSSQTDVEGQIRNTKKSLEEESLKLDAQLLEIINSQLKIRETKTDKLESGEKDHSLVLKVADEVTRILMNLEVMDKEIKGYKHLKKYSESILDNLKAYGYEIPQLIGMNYNSGMNMIATLEFDESVEVGKQIIKRIIKPQVNFEGKMIQAAKVTVAFND